MKMNTTEWKCFQIGGEKGLFNIVNGKGITKSELISHPGNIVAIQSGEENNGCIGYIDEKYCKSKGYHIQYEPALTVARSGASGHITYQDAPFVVGDSAKVLICKYNLTTNQFLFMKTILMENKKKYSYNDKVSEERYSEDKIKLPVKPDGEIDFEYMETFVLNIREMARMVTEELLIASNIAAKKVDITRFERFHLYDDDLFIIDSGTKLDKIRMSDNAPTVNFVGRANANNGVTDFIDKIDGLEPYKAGYMTISLGGEYLGSCFIQDKPFYTSQNVNVLIPKKEMSSWQKMYIATMVFREARLHYRAFIDELNRHMKTDFTIPLPVKDDGGIDWEYMELYMQSVGKKAKTKIDILL